MGPTWEGTRPRHANIPKRTTDEDDDDDEDNDEEDEEDDDDDDEDDDEDEDEDDVDDDDDDDNDDDDDVDDDDGPTKESYRAASAVTGSCRGGAAQTCKNKVITSSLPDCAKACWDDRTCMPSRSISALDPRGTATAGSLRVTARTFTRTKTADLAIYNSVITNDKVASNSVADSCAGHCTFQ